MKPTLKVIITSSDASLPAQFVRTLSAIDVTEHERKIPNPLSATKEEAVLFLETGRAEWDDVAVQGIALTAAKRYDFTWTTLLRETHGAVILLTTDSTFAIENVQRLVKLFARLELAGCLVGVLRAADTDVSLASIESALDTRYAVVPCDPQDAASVHHVVRMLVGLILPSEAPTAETVD